MALRLREFAALAEGWDLVPSTRVRGLQISIGTAPGYLTPSFGLFRDQHTHGIHTHRHTHACK